MFNARMARQSNLVAYPLLVSYFSVLVSVSIWFHSGYTEGFVSSYETTTCGPRCFHLVSGATGKPCNLAQPLCSSTSCPRKSGAERNVCWDL